MRRSDKVLCASLIFILGIAFQEIVAIPFFVLYVILLASLVFLSGTLLKYPAVLSRRMSDVNNSSCRLQRLAMKLLDLFLNFFQKRGLIVFFLFFLFGAFWLEVRLPKETRLADGVSGGNIIEEPVFGAKFQDFIIKDIYSEEKILVKTNLYPRYRYGDRLKLNCKFNPVSGKDSYGRYLIKDGIKGVCYYPKIELIVKDNGNKFYSLILGFKNRAREIIEKNLTYPESEILSAMLLGYKKQIPAELKEDFSKAGLSHIVAISGMHLVILSFILVWFLIEIGFSRKQVFYLALFLLWAYIVMVGLPSSAIRAGIMISVVLTGRHLGRASSLISSLFFTAFLILVFNPLLLFRDIGFQLSFLAVLGIIYFSPIFSAWLKKAPEFFGAKKILIITLAAQALTLPLSVFYFGNIPLLTLMVNLFFVPILPFILILGILIVLISLVLPGLELVIGIASSVILDSLLKVNDFFISLPLAYFYLGEVNFVLVLVIYVFLFFLAYKARKKHEFDISFN